MTKGVIAGIAAATALVIGAGGTTGYIASEVTGDDSAPVEEFKGCDGYDDQVDDRICFTRGFSINASLFHLISAKPFCVWKRDNPGQWQSTKAYLETGTLPTNSKTWMSAALNYIIEVYFFNGGKQVPMPVNNVPNACK